MISRECSINALAFSPDGRVVVTAQSCDPERDSVIKFWDVSTGREVRRLLPGKKRWTSALAFSPDGRYLASKSADLDTSSPRYDLSETIIWDIATGRAEQHIGGGKKPSVGSSSIVFTPDGRELITSGGGKVIQRWDVGTGREIATFDLPEVNGIAISPDGTMIASAAVGGVLALRDVTTGHELRSLGGQANAVRAVAVSPDGHTLVSGGSKGAIQLWDTATGKALLRFSGHADSVTELVFLRDGTKSFRRAPTRP